MLPNSPQKTSLCKVEWQRVNLLSAVPKKRKGQSMVAWKNRLYVFGGYFGQQHTGDLWVFFPGKNKLLLIHLLEYLKWKKLDFDGALPCKRSGHSACMYKQKMIIFGGDSGGNDMLNDLWELDLIKLKWTKISSEPATDKSSYPCARYAHSATIIQDKMYVHAGYGGTYLYDLWEFDLLNGHWLRYIARD